MSRVRGLWLVGALACGEAPPPDAPATPAPVVETGADDDVVSAPRPTEPWTQAVRVLLDGTPVQDALCLQGGGRMHVRTDAAGEASLRIDPSIRGDLVAVAAHPEARSRGVDLAGPTDLVVIELERFDPSDNPAYVFQDPGTPDRNDTTATCSHCHVRQVEDWVDHPHALAARNPVVHDVYAGTASVADQAACAEVGGRWGPVRRPGGGSHDACVIGGGTLADLDPACDPTCDAPSATGGCADCHAPGIDGRLGGRDLLEATGVAFEHGVHCDVCHKVADVDLTQPAGTAGRLRIVRPAEPDPSPVQDWRPLTFAPLPDVLNPRMGAAYAPVFQEARFCAGCHEHHQAVLVPGVAVDRDRWPDGLLPVHTTWSEWSAGALAGVAPCQACHMPPDPDAGNSADLDLVSASAVGRSGGWWRPPGASRRHAWLGPRSDEVDMVRLAVSVSVDTARDGDALVVRSTVRQTGAGHAVPTGEPLRAMVLRVDVTCDGTPQPAASGPAVGTVAGAIAARAAGEDWTRWPEAAPGDVVRVARDAGWRDDPGVGPFGDGTFQGEAKGLADLRVVGAATVLAVATDGTVTWSTPLPDGDRAFLGRAPGADVAPLAGVPGVAFARVLVDASGAEMVPHHRAVDVRSDNRLMPGAAWTGEHRFDVACDAPEARATLTYRRYPWALAAERGWENPERVVAEVVR